MTTFMPISTPIPASARTMRAAVYDRFGGPEVVRVDDVPVPQPGPNDVRIRARF